MGWVAAAQAAQPDEDFFAPRFNLITTRFAHSSADSLPAYQLSAGIVLPRQPDTTPGAPGFEGSYRLFPVAKPQPETGRTTNSHWQQAYGGNHLSLPRLLRIEFKVEQLNIALRPRSLLIEGERFKIILQPHSASLLWNKAF